MTMVQDRFSIFIVILLSILTILLALNFYKDYNKNKKEEREKTIFEKKIDQNKIDKIVIYNPYKIELVKKDDQWLVYPIDDLAYGYMVENIISNIYQPTVSEVFDFEKSYYEQFFSQKVTLYFRYNNQLYHLEKGIKNDFTGETYLWIDLPEFKDKIYIVNYWDFNYLDKNIDEFRMKKLLNLDQEKVDKIIINQDVIYREEIKQDKKNKKKQEEKVFRWKLRDGSLVSKEYINSFFAVLNNYDFKESYLKYDGLKELVSKVSIFSGDKRYNIEIYKGKKDDYIFKCSFRKYLLSFSSKEVEDWLKKEMIEKKIFSYYIDNFDDFDRLYISDSRAKFEFRKKEGKWFSVKNEEKTSQINLLFNILKDLEYNQRFSINPHNSKFELYTFEMIGKKKQKFYLYNPDYLSYDGNVYKIQPFVFILKELLK